MTTTRSAEIIAHRGASAEAPENTIEAFQLGLDQGADAIECDVHLSADGELVVIHDADLRRVAGIDKAINELALADLKALDSRIPSLSEVLDLVPAERRISSRLKSVYPQSPP
jgi:glycerophosphoryl diester phosphodiesterase